MVSAGLTPLEIRKLLGEQAYPATYTPAAPIPEEQARRTGSDFKDFIARMKGLETFILCRYLEGYTPELIADLLAAHPETIRIRIRRAGLFPTSTRGTPRRGEVNPVVRYYRTAVRQTFPGMIPQSFYA